MSSVWEIDNMPEFGSLSEDESTDVCIVGGGLAGVWCAYLLSKAGKRVTLLECDKLGRGATLYTTAFITELIDTPFEQLEKMFDKETSELVRKSGQEAIKMISAAVENEKIDCEFMRLPIEVYKELKNFKREKPNQVIENQAKYHPMKFFKSLVEAAQKSGAKFYEKTEVEEVLSNGVRTKAGQTVTAKDVVVATYEPFNNPEPVHFKKGMYVSYVFALELPKGAVKEGMYLDEENPYHYVRVDDLTESQRMIVGGEDHRAEIKFEEKQSFRALEEFIREAFSDIPHKVTHKWQGGILEPSDGLALIGEYEPHRFLAAAFSGNGMTYSAISGKIITDLIAGRENPYEKIYDPKRHLKPGAVIRKARDYAEEFLGGAVKNLFK